MLKYIPNLLYLIFKLYAYMWLIGLYITGLGVVFVLLASIIHALFAY